MTIIRSRLEFVEVPSVVRTNSLINNHQVHVNTCLTISELTTAMPMSPVSLSSPLSLYSIPVVWFTAFYPHLMKVPTTVVDYLFVFANIFLLGINRVSQLIKQLDTIS